MVLGLILGFTTTWDYTTLKQQLQEDCERVRFTTTWDYTTLKRFGNAEAPTPGFTTTWDYTTLKLIAWPERAIFVLLPLGITLLSNSHSRNIQPNPVLLPLGITLLSNKGTAEFHVTEVLLPLGITLLSNLKFQNGRYFVRKNGKTRRFPTVWSSTPTLRQSIRRQQNDYST